MASSIATPVSRVFAPPKRSMQEDVQNLQPHHDGRATPLPQYEKTQSVPFTLTLQEEKNNPGQFQLVVNVDPKNHPPAAPGSPPRSGSSKQLIASLKELPSLGYDVSQLYQTLDSSPPTSPQDERQGWSDLKAIPPEFLHKVVPDWKLTFSRNDSTASTQSRKLSDIKARIKKSGKGFVVRLLKGSPTDPDSNDVAEVHLGSDSGAPPHTAFELGVDNPPAELEASKPTRPVDNENPPSDVFEIGSSSQPGVHPSAVQPAATRAPAVNQWLGQVSEPDRRASIAEEGLSDAETLLPDIRSIADRMDDADREAYATNSFEMLGRSASTLSIVKTPTRGLSVVGPVKRVQKVPRARGNKVVRTSLDRVGARRSFRKSLPHHETLPESGMEEALERAFAAYRGSISTASNHSVESLHPASEQESRSTESSVLRHRSSAKESASASKTRSRLHLQTNVPKASSANTSPVTRRKRRTRAKKETSPTEEASPIWSEELDVPEVRAALDEAFSKIRNNSSPTVGENPAITEPEDAPADLNVGGILPPDVETRMPPSRRKNPSTIFVKQALAALIDTAFEVLKGVHETYRGDSPIPPNHVRVRWTCTCGESLHDDFIEQKPGAARDLEWYLNRPRSHTPPSPASKSSTFTSTSSLFDANSRASTLTTPASTYSGHLPCGKPSGSSSSRYSPTRLLTNDPFSVHIGASPPESWLLTCANESPATPKVAHLDVNRQRIKDDKSLAIAIREHYDFVHKGWFRWARLRGLSRIEFAQFEVHRNRFADIRAAPSMPPISISSPNPNPNSTTISTTSSCEKDPSPSPHPYTFTPHDLLPPVGPTYLMHLLAHPSDYEGETLTYERSPKRLSRLHSGLGWGLHLIDGFQPSKVWAVLLGLVVVGSVAFGVAWSVGRGDVQGAFGVASWIVAVVGLGVAGGQGLLEGG